MQLLNRKRVLVPGGAGFLAPICVRRLAAPCDVLCVDNFYTGTKDNVTTCWAARILKLMRHDVTFPLYVEVDEIYNLACPASPIHYQRDPVQTTKTSVHGAINMLGLAKRVKAKILQASTSEVYGDPQVHPQTGRLLGQRQSDRHPRRATTKASAAPRRCFSTITASTSCAIKVARIFNTYGPRMHPNDGRVVSQLHRAGLAWRRADHDLRRRQADAQLLLCRRPHRRHRAHDGVPKRNHWASQSWQSSRIHNQRSCRGRHKVGQGTV